MKVLTHNIKVCTINVFLIFDIQKIIHTFVGMFMMYLCTKFRNPSCHDSLFSLSNGMQNTDFMCSSCCYLTLQTRATFIKVVCLLNTYHNIKFQSPTLPIRSLHHCHVGNIDTNFVEGRVASSAMKFPNIKFHENPCSNSWVVADGQMWWSC
jgi:hypothetical protein